MFQEANLAFHHRRHWLPPSHVPHLKNRHAPHRRAGCVMNSRKRYDVRCMTTHATLFMPAICVMLLQGLILSSGDWAVRAVIARSKDYIVLIVILRRRLVARPRRTASFSFGKWSSPSMSPTTLFVCWPTDHVSSRCSSHDMHCSSKPSAPWRSPALSFSMSFSSSTAPFRSVTAHHISAFLPFIAYLAWQIYQLYAATSVRLWWPAHDYMMHWWLISHFDCF